MDYGYLSVCGRGFMDISFFFLKSDFGRADLYFAFLVPCGPCTIGCLSYFLYLNFWRHQITRLRGSE